MSVSESIVRHYSRVVVGDYLNIKFDIPVDMEKVARYI